MSVGLQFERERAYRRLLELFLNGSFDPEAPLSERKLSDALNIGRTPVREALRELARDGVIEVLPARGTFVRRLSVQDMREIYEIRQSIECMAAALAAERGPMPELRAFGPKFRSALEQGGLFDAAITYETGADFHVEIFRSARNHHLLQIYERLRLRFRITLGLPRYYDHDRVRASVAEHAAILEAIEAGDREAASTHMSVHLTKGLQGRMRIFEALAEQNAAAGNEENAVANP